MKNAEARIHQALTDYPSQFWVLMAASLIDMTGGWMLFPFFSLYFTARFGVSMAQVGVFLGIFSTGMLAGSTLGGALADRVGRKPVLLLGLVASASSSVGLGLVVDFRAAYCLTFLAGAFGEIGAPAYQAMIADLLPEAQRSNGYGITRWVSKLPPMRVMAAATLLYAVGFGAFGVAAAYGVLAAAVAVITIGEMAWVPTWQATSVKFAPKAYRGRYLAVSSLILVLPGMVGPGLAGMAMDAFGGRFVWYAGALLCLLGAAGYRWVEKFQFPEITNG